MSETSSRLPFEGFARLKQAIIERTGHFYYEDKDELLWERVRRRLSATRLNAVDYADRLADRESGEAEWVALEAELTIGETYFFRYPEQFTALRETILPELIEQRSDRKRLRIWSAGCATGAEPYSVAILLHELLADDLANWRVNILGTDINDSLLRAAREARFSPWAVRSLGRDELNAWFVAAGRDWSLKPQFRGMVRFQRGNLLDLIGPTPPLDLADFDVILCRNVLIYFHPAKVAEVAAALTARLPADGWLMVGHAEPNPEFGRFATPVALAGAVAYRPLNAPARPGGASASAAPTPTAVSSAWAPLLPPPVPLRELSSLPPAEPPEAVHDASPPAAAGALEEAIAEVRRRADVGDFDGAERKCRERLKAHPDDPRLHFYLGLLEQAVGRLAPAEDALRRAIYLDPTFVMAQYHLGLVRLARGRVEEGRRAVAAAAQMAGTLTLGTRLPEGAGLTAGELRDMARIQLETCGGGGQ